MLGVALAGLFGWALFAVARLVCGDDRRMPLLLVGGFILRIILSFWVRDLPIFSHVAGGDCVQYEEHATWIAKVWDYTGIHFVSSDEFPDMGATTLPPNIFALVIFLNGGPTRVGCTAVVAFLVGLVCLNVYNLGRERGASVVEIQRTIALLYFGPAFLLYTSDTFKDGLVVAFVLGALCSALRLAKRFSFLHAAVGVLCLMALWYVRFYLVFATTAPLVVGLVGIGAKSPARIVVAALLMLAVALVLTGYTDIIQRTGAQASATFEHGTSRAVLDSNAATGSGVAFDDGGSPFGALGQKVAYTLFSPFPWASGSLGFHVGKLDAFLWYYLLYHAIRTARRIWSTDSSYVLMVVTFIVPSTIMYATSMSNVGLIVRERLIIVAASVLLSMRWRGQTADDAVPASRGSAIAVPE